MFQLPLSFVTVPVIRLESVARRRLTVAKGMDSCVSPSVTVPVRVILDCPCRKGDAKKRLRRKVLLHGCYSPGGKGRSPNENSHTLINNSARGGEVLSEGLLFRYTIAVPGRDLSSFPRLNNIHPTGDRAQNTLNPRSPAGRSSSSSVRSRAPAPR